MANRRNMSAPDAAEDGWVPPWSDRYGMFGNPGLRPEIFGSEGTFPPLPDPTAPAEPWLARPSVNLDPATHDSVLFVSQTGETPDQGASQPASPGRLYNPFPADGPYAIGRMPDLSKGEGIQPYWGLEMGAPATPSASTPDAKHPVQPGSTEQKTLPSINLDYLRGREGQTKDIYPPAAPKPGEADPAAHAGLSLGTGVDLHWHTADDYRAWGVPEDDIEKLVSLQKYQGDKARQYYRDNKGRMPQISDAGIAALDRGARDSIISTVQRQYDATNPPQRFADLPERYRTAIISVAYHHGPYLAKATPKLWHQITTGDWSGAVGNLKDFRDRYGPRREMDAYYMQYGTLKPR